MKMRIILITILLSLSTAYLSLGVEPTKAAPIEKPASPRIQIGGLDIDPKILSLGVAGASIYNENFVWTQKEASRFVESLLLGLPVPGVFLARESESKKLLVIDGQQRLKTLQYFFAGITNPPWANQQQTGYRTRRGARVRRPRP